MCRTPLVATYKGELEPSSKQPIGAVQNPPHRNLLGQFRNPLVEMCRTPLVATYKGELEPSSKQPIEAVQKPPHRILLGQFRNPLIETYKSSYEPPS